MKCRAMRSIEFAGDMDLHSYPTRCNLKSNIPVPAKLKKHVASIKHREIDSRVLFTWLDSCIEGKIKLLNVKIILFFGKILTVILSFGLCLPIA